MGLGFVQQYQAPLVANQIKEFILPALQKREDEYKAEMQRIKNNQSLHISVIKKLDNFQKLSNQILSKSPVVKSRG